MSCRKCQKELPEGAAFCPWCGARQAVPARTPKRRGNGQGTAYKTASGNWQVEFCAYTRGVRHRRTKGGFRTKKEALAYLPVLQGIVPEPARKTLRLADAHALWQETRRYQKLSDDKKSHYRTAWNRLTDLHYRDIASLRFCELQAAVDAAPGKFYPKRDVKNLLSHLYKIAIREEALTAAQDRIQYIELPDTPASEREFFHSAEVAAIWADYRDGHAIAGYALDMIYTGMRPGELRQITKANVHLDERYMIGGIKTDAGKERVIPLAEVILPVIRAQLEASRHGLIDWNEEDFYDEWGEMVNRTGIRPLPPYCCRHTAATALDEAGVDRTVIMEIMGHKDYNTTLIYTHVSPERKVEAINRIQPEKE